MPSSGGLEGRDGPRLELAHPQRSRRCIAVGFLRVIASALPGNEGAPDREKRGRVLDEHGKRGQRSRCHEVMRADSLRPSLGTGRDGLGVRELQALDRTPYEGDLPTNALHQSHTRIGKRDRQHEPRKPTTRAEIGDPPRTSHLGQLERDERIGHMHVNTPRRIPHRRDRTRLLGHELEQQRETIHGRGRQAVALRELGETGCDLGEHGHGGMEAGRPRARPAYVARAPRECGPGERGPWLPAWRTRAGSAAACDAIADGSGVDFSEGFAAPGGRRGTQPSPNHPEVALANQEAGDEPPLEVIEIVHGWMQPQRVRGPGSRAKVVANPA